mmetsp:Transcript_108925/g.216314  ORF Transcript_108925/g.216314 Transcript_108925/m.216314 type:complete len:236 (+) Transcript_108925:636-1343(+)
MESLHFIKDGIGPPSEGRKQGKVPRLGFAIAIHKHPHDLSVLNQFVCPFFNLVLPLTELFGMLTIRRDSFIASVRAVSKLSESIETCHPGLALKLLCQKVALFSKSLQRFFGIFDSNPLRLGQFLQLCKLADLSHFLVFCYGVRILPDFKQGCIECFTPRVNSIIKDILEALAFCDHGCQMLNCKPVLYNRPNLAAQGNNILETFLKTDTSLAEHLLNFCQIFVQVRAVSSKGNL